MPKWFFLAKRPDRPAMGDAFRNTFEGEHVSRSLARESIQNSVDAARSDQVPEVRFTFRENVPLTPLLTEDFRSHANASGVPAVLSSPVVSALYVEDFGTTGLTGSMQEMESNFYRLMGQLGGGDTGGGRGGSFGYGKAACILASECRVVVAYTVTESGSALFGTCYLDPYHVLGCRYTGLGWFAHDDSTDDAPIEVWDDEADELARRLGFPDATSREIGTSLLIPCTRIDAEELRRNIEAFWWPRLVDHRLSVYINYREAEHVPSPQKNNDLRDSIELYETIQKRSGARNGDCVVPISRDRKTLGTLAMRFLPDFEESEDDGSLVAGSIALMRDQRMVVNYYRWSQGPRCDLVGVFVAHTDINEDLRLTEDPKHSTWSSSATRATEVQRKLAKYINDEIRKQYRRFLKEYAPPPTHDEDSLQELRRFFGHLFSTKGQSGGGSKAAPVEITDKRAVARPCDGGLRLEGSAQIRYQGKKAMHLRIGVAANLAESDVSNAGDPLALTLTANQRQYCGEEPRLALEMKPGDSIEIQFQTVPYDASWTCVARFFAEAQVNEAN